MKKLIIVHPGNAHLDEFVACAEALVAEAWIDPDSAITLHQRVTIARREPTAEEINNPEVLVLDVGGVHDPARACFDHHQLPRGTHECAMTLFAKSVRHPTTGESLYDIMCRLYPWYATRCTLDSCGPYNAAREEGVEWETVAKFLGPFEDIVLSAFADGTDDERVGITLHFANDILVKIEAESCVRVALERWTTAQGVDVIDFTRADPADVDVVSDAILAPVRGGVAILQDKRGPGYALLRIKDDPRVDLSKATDLPCMRFVHANGFYATTKEPLARAHIADILGTAYVEQKQS